MSYKLQPDESVENSIRRIAREQIDKAVTELRDQDLSQHDKVHQVRKRCKKVRGLVRLVRPAFESTYTEENAWYRDAAKSLSYVRDAHSIIETLDTLNEDFKAELKNTVFTDIRKGLVKQRDEIVADQIALDELLQTFEQQMLEGRVRVSAWRLENKGFDAIKGGFLTTYSRARDALSSAFEHPDTENFHEWRKRVKYHWYHLRLLQPLWKQPLGAQRDEADKLSDLLGDDHDLSVLRSWLVKQKGVGVDADRVQVLTGIINQKQVELRARAGFLGGRLFADKPKSRAKLVRRYWKIWRKETTAEVRSGHYPRLVTE